jgi:hypothetical protein
MHDPPVVAKLLHYFPNRYYLLATDPIAGGFCLHKNSTSPLGGVPVQSHKDTFGRL